VTAAGSRWWRWPWRGVAGGSGGDVGGCCGACPIPRRRDRRAPRPPGRARGPTTSAGGTERCATHVSLSVRTTTGSRIADVAPSYCIHRTAGRYPLFSITVTRSSASPTRYYYHIVSLFSSVRVLDLVSPFDPVVVDFIAGDIWGTVEPFDTITAVCVVRPFHRYRFTVNDVPRTVPTRADKSLRHRGETIHQKLNHFWARVSHLFTLLYALPRVIPHPAKCFRKSRKSHSTDFWFSGDDDTDLVCIRHYIRTENPSSSHFHNT